VQGADRERRLGGRGHVRGPVEVGNQDRHREAAVLRGGLELGGETGISLHRDHVHAVLREVKGDSPSARAEFEHRPGSGLGQLAPEGEVHRVRAEFDLLPDRGVLVGVSPGLMGQSHCQ